MPLPDKQYFSLKNLTKRWGVEEEDIRYYIEHNELAVCCWLDFREVMRYLPDKNSNSITCDYVDYEGYVGLNSRDCRKIFRCKKYRVSDFVDLKQKDFHLALTPQSRDAFIGIDDIRINITERNRFEKLHGIETSKILKPCKASIIGKIDTKIARSNKGLYLNMKKQEFYFNGRQLNLGPIQSNIIHQLSLSHSSDKPWIHSKELLTRAGSQAMRMRDIFKTQYNWREIIESNKRGHYRIFEDILVEVA